MPTVHIMNAYDQELKFLASRIASMGGLAERMVDESVKALVHHDPALARKVIADDVLLDEGQREIDDKAIVIIARRQPMADDLREIIGAIRISSDLERVGDLGKNIAKRVLSILETPQPVRLSRGLEALAQLALVQLKEVLDCYATSSVERIGTVRDRDDDPRRLLEQARNRHYSTFSLYAEAEFEKASQTFKDDVRRQFDDPAKVAWHDQNVLLQIERSDA